MHQVETVRTDDETIAFLHLPAFPPEAPVMAEHPAMLTFYYLQIMVDHLVDDYFL